MAFHVDEFGTLHPLGVKVIRNSRFELLPTTRDYFEEIPGRDGEFDFGCDFESRIIELQCFIKISPSEWFEKEREIAGYLNPKLGVQELTFANAPNKVFKVRYAGKLDYVEEGPGYRKFVIPFKMTDPYIYSATESVLNGTGTALNKGNVPTPCIIEIKGSVTNPVVQINGVELKYTGLVTASDTLIIDTDKKTVTFNGVNALANYNGVFPKLKVGNNTITGPSGGSLTIKWFNKWI